MKNEKLPPIGKKSRLDEQSDQISPRWSHRLKFALGEKGVDQFKLFDPMGMKADNKSLKPQPYPNESACFYFKPGKRYNIVYQGKIGTFEQWANELGMDAVKLRDRVRVCAIPLQEALTVEPLNTTDHSKPGARAYKYCPCHFCVSTRLEKRSDSLIEVQPHNKQDKGKIFKRSDGVWFIQFGNQTMDLQSIADSTQIPYATLHARIFVYKWPLSRALTKKTPKMA